MSLKRFRALWLLTHTQLNTYFDSRSFSCRVMAGAANDRFKPSGSIRRNRGKENTVQSSV